MKRISGFLNNFTSSVRDNLYFVIILCLFGLLFWMKMFTNVLYDDEIGFYLSPTSRGIFYSFFIYETTGYHILYAGLSAILNKLGNVYFAIRGVSFIAWLLSNLVIYRACRLKCGKSSSSMAILIYNMLYCVNFYAVAGRGYMLINLWFALAVYFSMRLAEDIKNRKLWLGFIGVNICGFWTISTYLYAFLTVVIVFGLYLLIQKEYKAIWNLFWHCVIIGIGVFLVYCPVFVCTRLYELYEQGIIDKSAKAFLETLMGNPFACLSEGIRSFLDSTNYYITHRTYSELMTGLGDFFQDMSVFLFFKPFPVLSVVCYCIVWVLAFVSCILKKNKFAYLCSTVGLILFLPIVFLQRIFPFERLFAYLGVAIAISMASIFEEIPLKLRGIRKYLGLAFVIATVLLHMQLDYSNPQHDTIDESVEKAVETIPNQLKKEDNLIVYVDAFQQRNYMILWGRMNQVDIEFGKENPDIVILSADSDIAEPPLEGMKVFYQDPNITAWY